MFGGCQAGVEIDEQITERQQVGFERSGVDSLAQDTDHLFRHELVEIPDRRKVRVGIAADKLDRSGHTVKEGLEQIVRVRRGRT